MVKNKKKKFFSIITSVFNGEKFIQELFNSLVQQNFKDFEYIVVDGGSTDNTRKLIKKNSHLIDKIIFKKDNNMYEGIKRGFNNAVGKYYIWLNSDDFLIDKYSLYNLHKYLIKNKKQWVICKTSFFFQRSLKLKTYFPLIYPKKFIQNGWCHSGGWGFIQQENTIFSSKLYKLSGGIDTKFKQAGDFYLWKKFSNFSSLETANIDFATQRVWDQQQTKTAPNLYFEEIKKKRTKINLIYPLRIIISYIFFLKKKLLV